MAHSPALTDPHRRTPQHALCLGADDSRRLAPREEAQRVRRVAAGVHHRAAREARVEADVVGAEGPARDQDARLELAQRADRAARDERARVAVGRRLGVVEGLAADAARGARERHDVAARVWCVRVCVIFVRLLLR